MDDNNQFLNSYKKKINKQEQPSDTAASAQDKPGDKAQPEEKALRFEEKSDFLPARPISDGPSPSLRRRSRWLPAALVSAVVLVLAVFLIWLLTRGVEVIDLTGWTLNDAQLWASDNDIRLQVTEEYSDEVAVDRIIGQQPLPGTQLKKNGFLQIRLSLGHDLSVTLPLPDFHKMTMAEVEAWAEENYMTRVRITTEYHEEIEADKVIRYEVNDDTVVNEVRRSSPVYVIVSRGPSPLSEEKVTIPDFREMSLLQSQQFASSNKIVLKIVEQYDELFPAGTILEQSIVPEEEVVVGSEVTLMVSLGKKVLVPNFSGYSREQAAAVASELGINMTISERYSSRSAGRFIEQSLEAGSIYNAGEILELAYSLGNEIILPSFVGQTRAQIEAWAADLNAQKAAIRISVSLTEHNTPRDTIIYQDKTNTVISPGTTVHVTVSLGSRVFVPDLIAPQGSVYGVAVTRDIALAQLEPLNLVPVFVAEKKAGRLPGEIWQQSIAAGTEVFETSTITLKYNPVDVTLAIPDFRGMSEAEIVQAGFLQKLTITFMLADEPVEGMTDQVVGQSLPTGTTVAAGTAITLRIAPPEPLIPTEPQVSPDPSDPQISPDPSNKPSVIPSASPMPPETDGPAR